MEKEVEVWKDIIGLEDYYKVSNFGNVFSKRSNKIIKPALLENGYLRVQSKLNGEIIRFRVHKAVAETFVKLKRDDQMFVNHINGDKQDNHYLNLEWCTLSENQTHARAIGLRSMKYEKESRKLSDADVKFIRDNHTKGCKEHGVAGLSKMFKVSRSIITRLLKGETYKDVI